MAKSSDIFLFDLMSIIRKDPARASRIAKASERLAIIDRQVREGKASRQDLAAAQAEMLPACGYNFGLLIPECFPKYPLDKPLSLVSRPFMFAMTCMAPDSIVTLRAGRQVGKCVTGETTVLTKHGNSVSLEQLFDLGLQV